MQAACPWVLQRLEQQGKAAGVAGIRLHPDPEPAEAGLKPTGWLWVWPVAGILPANSHALARELL